ncbi:hypothetical protein BRARA_B02646 [Brassica rapa]|uniref:Uncharacterized protein n=1 Tax=Brassica campestris TaxID=3711 RepID=A0A398ACQ6_BRACM|nr:hypothetical protein BRARA_B02646 [Brassica rapa]
MTSGDFKIAGISTGKWWSSPTNSTAAVFSGYSLPRPTETSLDITDCRRQNFDNKTNNYNDDFFNIFPFLEKMFLIDSEAESFLDYETKEPKEIITQDCKNLTSKRNGKIEELEETSDDYSPPLLKRPGIDTLSPLPRFKVRKEKLGDRITGLQHLVSPFVKYLKFLQEQVTVLSNLDQNIRGSVQRQQLHVNNSIFLSFCMLYQESSSQIINYQLMIIALINTKNSINTQEQEDYTRRPWEPCIMFDAEFIFISAAASAAEMNTSNLKNFPILLYVKREVTLVISAEFSIGYSFGFGSGISDFQVFRYRGVEPVRVFLYFGSGSGIFSSDSVISDLVRIFRF